jgi:predicted acylesterase/phospholipase RssA
VNGAAIVQGISAERLEEIWLQLREKDIQGLPPGMQLLARWMTNRVLKRMIGVTLGQVPAARATSPIPEEYWPPLPLLPRWLSEALTGRWLNLLDTGPLLTTLQDTFELDMQKIADREKHLMITATNVQTGSRVIFSNQIILDRATGNPREDVLSEITLQRILASCSIPLVYPWTYDPASEAYYWDGAVVANTPLGAALDAVSDVPLEVPMEVVVVLMTPWWEKGELPPHRMETLPESFGDAITWTLDWALLASFRERLQLTQAYNRLARQERREGKEPLRYREVNVTIVAPQEFFPVSRILDYDQWSSVLIEKGYQAAQRAFQSRES